MISDEGLPEYKLMRFSAIGALASAEEVEMMAKELLAHRKAWSEPVGFVAECPCTSGYGGTAHSFSIAKDDARWDADEHEGFYFEVYRKPDTGEA